MEPGLRRQMESLQRLGAVFEQRRGRWALHARARLTTGRLVKPGAAFGFVVPDEGQGGDLFISGRRLSGAQHGDRVLARTIGSGRGGPGRTAGEGEIVAVMERRPPYVLGLYRGDGREGILIPRDQRIASEVILSGGDADQTLPDGDLVWAEITAAATRFQPARGKPIEPLGPPEDPAAQERAVVCLYGLTERFPRAVLREAALQASEGRVEAEGREDFTGDVVVTVDPADARDHDDAVGLREVAGSSRRQMELAVHIADVAHYIGAGSAIDQEARRRATSVYFPGRCIPMLPEALSADLCSLLPDRPRLVQSVLIRYNDSGEQVSCRFADGVIRSRARLTYDDVTQQLEGAGGDLAPMLRRMEALAQRLRERRMRRGSLDLDIPSLRIDVDDEGRPTGIHPTLSGPAHHMIEEFMLAANEAVAGHLSKHTAPALYRIHEDPEPEAIAEVEQSLARLGYPVPRGRGAAAARIRSLLAAFKDRPEGAAVSMMILRALKLARYSEEPQGHFGLASPIYTHFTSPIRRYPDLAVHRSLRRLRQGIRATDGEAESSQLALLADECSRLERRAEEAERTITDWKAALFMKGHIGREYGGMVTGVTPHHLFVTLDGLGVEGAIQRDAERRPSSRARARRAPGRSVATEPWRLGERLRVRVAQVDLLRGRVQLTPLDSPR